MDKDSKIYVTGHRGLVGSHLIRKFHEAKQSGVATVTVWGTGV